MTGRHILESITGFVVLLVAILSISLVYYNGYFSITSNKTYPIYVRFASIDGIDVGTDVKVGGIKVGFVKNLELDPKDYKAVVTLAIFKEIQLPTDTQASIIGGLLESKYLSLSPGGQDDVIPEGGEIEYAQSPVSIENLIGKYIFGNVENGRKE